MEKHIVPDAHAKQPTERSPCCKSVTTNPRVLPLRSSPLTSSPLSTRTITNEVAPTTNATLPFDQQKQQQQHPHHDQQPNSYTWADAPTVLTVYHWCKDARATPLGNPVAGIEADGATLRLERSEQRNCRLCEKQYLAYEGMVPLPCGHWFHQGCIKPRLAEWFGCPACGVEMVWVLGLSR